MKKRIIAVIMAAMLAVSFAACNNGGDSGSSSAPASKAESSAESKTEESSEASEKTSDKEETKESSTEEKSEQSQESSEQKSETESTPDETSKEQTSSDKTNLDAFGEKTKAAFELMQSDECTVSVTIKMESKATGEESQDQMAAMLSMMGDKGFTIESIKDKNGNSRYIMDMVIMKTDTLTTPEGTYLIDEATKTAYFTKAGDDTSTESNMIDSFTNTEGMELADTGSEDFNGKKCDYERYIVKHATSQLAVLEGEEVSTDSDQSYEMKFYFDGDKAVGGVISAQGQKMVITINELSDKADASKLKVPDGYKVEENDGSAALGAILGGLTSGLETSDE